MSDSKDDPGKDSLTRRLFLSDNSREYPEGLLDKKRFDKNISFSEYEEIFVDEKLRSSQAIVKFLRGKTQAKIILLTDKEIDKEAWGVDLTVTDLKNIEEEYKKQLENRNNGNLETKNFIDYLTKINNLKNENGGIVINFPESKEPDDNGDIIEGDPIGLGLQIKLNAKESNFLFQNKEDKTDVIPIVKQAVFRPFANIKSKIAEFNIKEYMSFVWCNRLYRMIIISFMLATILGSSLFIMTRANILGNNIVIYKNFKIEIKK